MGLFDFGKRKANQLYQEGLALYREGRREDARSSLQKAAELGHEAAAPLLTRMDEEDRQQALQKRFYQGLAAGKAKDYKSVCQIMLPLAQDGHAESQFVMAMMYHSGNGVERSLQEARSWAEKAARQGHEKAAAFLKEIDSDIQLEEQNTLIDLYNQGIDHHKKEDYNAAYNCFYEAATKGLAEAQRALALMYWDGTVYRKDFELVQIWLQKAIDQGLAGAAELLDKLRFEESKILLERAIKWEDEGCGYNAYDSFSQSAKLGNPLAKTLLALKLEAGEDCHKDVREAHRLFLEAADNGIVVAQLHAAQLYVRGDGLELDYDKARALAQKILDDNDNKTDDREHAAALLENINSAWDQWTKFQPLIREKGMAFAQAVYCDIVENKSVAFNFYYKSAEAGDAEAQYTVGTRYMAGEGIKKDYGKALHWLRAAAEQGYEPAKKVLRDTESTLETLAKHDEIRSCTKSAIAYLDEGDEIQAFFNFLEAAELGDMGAQRIVAQMYQTGRGVLSNTRKALYWYIKAAEQGNDKACFEAARLLYYGEIDIKVDYEASMKWARRGAELGNAPCHTLVGAHYLEGNGVPQIQTEAIRWFQKGAALGDESSIALLHSLGVPVKTAPAAAPTPTPSPVQTASESVDAAVDPEFQQKLLAANQGDAEAQYELGMCYNTGKGAPKDADAALMWFRKAADQGHEPAKAVLFLKERGML